MEWDISSLYARLRLTEKEAQVLEVEEAENGLSVEKRAKCIAFKVLVDREVNKGALKNTLLQLWQLEGKGVIKEVGRNTFLLELVRVSDKKRIMAGRPWSFDKSLLCLHDCENVNNLKEIAFNEEVFWVQCHDLPFAGMTQKTGCALGERLGKVLVVDTDSSGVYLGAFLRIKKDQGAAIGEGIEQQYGPWLRATRKHYAGISLPEGAAQPQLNLPVSNPDLPQTGIDLISGETVVEDIGKDPCADIQEMDSCGDAQPSGSELMDLGQRQEVEGSEVSTPKRIKRVQGEVDVPVLAVAAQQPCHPP
ncbi:unnamed protein product [Fraxinus pennsylvanica]|uniref:DUF4283 domain-containing protein n=1 Tax=Fraxinus pennsylvanica TaxID=56036 RepID=A0AAD1ZK35_9LAMI|nr:unnamed protein product [Fraxinus pennsylvanica]